MKIGVHLSNPLRQYLTRGLVQRVVALAESIQVLVQQLAGPSQAFEAAHVSGHAQALDLIAVVLERLDALIGAGFGAAGDGEGVAKGFAHRVQLADQ